MPLSKTNRGCSKTNSVKQNRDCSQIYAIERPGNAQIFTSIL
jgi:hypothetical protein